MSLLLTDVVGFECKAGAPKDISGIRSVVLILRIESSSGPEFQDFGLEMKLSEKSSLP